jgi:hypothetical protein
MHTRRKITASLSYVTVEEEGTVERARGQDILYVVTSPPSPPLRPHTSSGCILSVHL